MNKRETARQYRRLLRIVDKWQKLYGLSEWDIIVEIINRDSDLPLLLAESYDNFNAVIAPSWSYMKASIYMRVESLLNYDDAYLEEIVQHELAHCLVNEIAPEGDDPHEERVVTMVTAAIRRAYTAGRHDLLKEQRVQSRQVAGG